MKIVLDVQGQSQYQQAINEAYRNSACGPTTANVILNYICQETELSKKSINELYNYLGASKIGLFKWQMIRKLQKLLGNEWEVSECTVNEAMMELQNGRPVAMKFDKYFSFKWHLQPTYRYHWVPLIGYEIRAGKLYFIIHDNGGRNRKSEVREVLYEQNREVLSFVKFSPRLF
jgi:hypothetical protein